MALWHSLFSLSQQLHLQLVVAHLNHGLRKNESDEDALWIQEKMEHSKIPLFIKKVDTEAEAEKRKLGIEETARLLRYSFFEEVSETTGAQFLATGHHLDDQAETVFMRMVRGAGMEGLGGIPPVNQLKKLKIIRPLIQSTREEILNYLKTEKKSFRIDKSNADIKYRRNFVRHSLLPQIEKECNPAVKTILSRSAEQHRAVNVFIQEEVEKWWTRSVRLENKRAQLKGGVLKKAPSFMKQEIVKRVLRKLAPGCAEKLHFEHIFKTTQLFSATALTDKISLPDGVLAEKKGKDVVISIGANKRVC